MYKVFSILLVLNFSGAFAQQIEQAFFDTTARIFVIKDAPFDKWQPQGDDLLLAVSEDGGRATFVLKRMAKEPFYLTIAEFSAEQVDVQFFNSVKMYGEPAWKNDTISFMFEMPYRSAMNTLYFLATKENKRYNAIKFLYSDYDDPSSDALQSAEESLEKGDIAKAVEWYHAVTYPQYYMDEKEVAYGIMKKGHEVAMGYFKAGDFSKAAKTMNDALTFYGNTTKLDYKTSQEMNEDLADSTSASWTKQLFKRWLGDYGLFLYKAKDYEASVIINSYLNKMIPYLTGPYLQLGDTYYDMGKKAEAKTAYTIYCREMKEQKKDKLIPKRVKERLKK